LQSAEIRRDDVTVCSTWRPRRRPFITLSSVPQCPQKEALSYLSDGMPLDQHAAVG